MMTKRKLLSILFAMIALGFSVSTAKATDYSNTIAAAIHPLLPIAVTFSACASHCTKCASPKSIYQLY